MWVGLLSLGQTSSTFDYSPASAGSYSITVTVTDSLGSTSVQSAAATVTVAASPTVSIAPVGPFTMDVGQTKTVYCYCLVVVQVRFITSGMWVLERLELTVQAILILRLDLQHSVTCKVTDSASTPVTSPASNAVTVTVNAASDCCCDSCCRLLWMLVRLRRLLVLLLAVRGLCIISGILLGLLFLDRQALLTFMRLVLRVQLRFIVR